MYKFICLLFAVILTSTVTLNAQDTVRTLIKPVKIRKVGFYFAPEYQYAQSNAAFTSYAGGSAMLIFNKKLALGVTQLQTIDDNFAPKGVAPLSLQSGIFGTKIEYTLRPDAAVHITFPLVLGMGYAAADTIDTDTEVANHNHTEGHNNGRDNKGFDANYFVIQPGVQLETNLTRHIKVFAGANYRISPATGTTTLPKDALQGLSMAAGLKVGLFDISACKRRSMHKSVPAEALSSFQKKFPSVNSKIAWDKERNGEWEAEWTENGKEKTANFTSDGKWLETESEVTLAELPAALQTTVQNTKVKRFERIEKADGTILYEVEESIL